MVQEARRALEVSVPAQWPRVGIEDVLQNSSFITKVECEGRGSRPSTWNGPSVTFNAALVALGASSLALGGKFIHVDVLFCERYISEFKYLG